MKKFLLFIILIVIYSSANAQQIEQFSQRLLDMLEYNPSVAGSKLNHEIRIHHRSQWIGIEGAPVTQVVSYCGSLGRSNGIGAYITNDKVGVTSNKSITLDYAYHIPFYNFNLSLGAGASAAQFSIDGQKFILRDPDDNAVNQSLINSKPIPSVSGGLLAYNSKFYAGVSFKRSFETQMEGNLYSYLPATWKYYFISGIDISKNIYWSFFPGITLYGSNIEATQVEFNFKAEYLNNYMFGVSFRMKNSVVVFAGLRILKQLFLAYSYDYILSDLSKYSMGSHELILYIELPYSKSKTVRMFDVEQNPREYIKHHM